MNFQDYVADLYKERGYTKDLSVLALGLCEEAGEVAAAVLDRSVVFKKKPGRAQSDLEHELLDCLTYLCAIANSEGIRLPLESCSLPHPQASTSRPEGQRVDGRTGDGRSEEGDQA